MLLVNQIIFKMATNGKQTSDFSIDHILNRAGDRFAENRHCERFEMISMNSNGSSSGDESNSCEIYDKKSHRSEFVDNERYVEIPAFDWLNYTRYNMPRLQRKWPAQISCII